MRLEKIFFKDFSIWLNDEPQSVQLGDLQVLFRQRGGESLNELSLEKSRDGESGSFVF